jgi:hypothetical protein
MCRTIPMRQLYKIVHFIVYYRISSEEIRGEIVNFLLYILI